MLELYGWNLFTVNWVVGVRSKNVAVSNLWGVQAHIWASKKVISLWSNTIVFRGTILLLVNNIPSLHRGEKGLDDLGRWIMALKPLLLNHHLNQQNLYSNIFLYDNFHCFGSVYKLAFLCAILLA